MQKVSLLFLVVFFSFFSSLVHAETSRMVPNSPAQVQLSFAPVVKSVAPAVVNIYTRKVVRKRLVSPFLDDPFFQQFFGGSIPRGLTRERLENSLGSGVIVKPDGLIVTSYHVIAGADEIIVVLADRREFEAKLVSRDERSDLAVLRIQTKGETLPYLQMKDSDDAQVGDMVIAIGNPFGVGQTVTSGIISALARTNLDINDLNYFIQTDAAINPGNSGGALVTLDGKLIGINAAIYSKSGGYMGIGFAVPSNMVRAVVESKTESGVRVVRPWSGIRGQEVTPEIADSLGLARPSGFLVSAVHPASPALQGGLRVGDVITGVNGREVEDAASFGYRIATLPIGGEAVLDVLRAGQKVRVSFALIAPPESPQRNETLIKGGNPLAGASVANLSPALIEDYGLTESDEKGVVVVKIAAGSAADRLGVGPGDIILKINGQVIESVAMAEQALLSKPRAWRLAIKRGGQIVNLLVGG